MMPPTSASVTLQDVLYQFSIAKEEPDAALLSDFVRSYPQYATVLTEFAVALVLDSRQPGLPETIDVSKTSPSVSRAISKFQNALHQLRTNGMAAVVESAIAQAKIVNPFDKYDRNGFRSLAKALGVNSVFLCKLRDRQIASSTMTTGFVKYVSEKLGLGQQVLAEFFSSQQSIPTGQFYNASKKPEVMDPQTFEDAVRNSQLSDDQQQFLLSL